MHTYRGCDMQMIHSYRARKGPVAESCVLNVECKFAVKVCLLLSFSLRITFFSQTCADVLSTDSLMIKETSSCGKLIPEQEV